MVHLAELFKKTRTVTVKLCDPLETEDYVVQPVEEVSPPKWHLGHTSWFFEVFILEKYLKEYKLYHGSYSFLFNSYYDNVGERVIRAERGNLTRPTVKDVYHYRDHVNAGMERLFALEEDLHPDLK